MQPKPARTLRIESEIQRALAELIGRELKDPRVGSVTITAVSAAPDMSEARVFFLPFGGAHAPDEVHAGLTRAAGFLRGAVGRRLGLRHAPRLVFLVDEQLERANRLADLIDSVRKRDAAGAAPADPAEPADE
jgi:ribosome-binding factor A